MGLEPAMWFTVAMGAAVGYGLWVVFSLHRRWTELPRQTVAWRALSAGAALNLAVGAWSLFAGSLLGWANLLFAMALLAMWWWARSMIDDNQRRD